MKVRVTFDIDDTDRVAISVRQGNGFKPAPRADIEAHIFAVVTASLGDLRDRFDVATRLFMEKTDE